MCPASIWFPHPSPCHLLKIVIPTAAARLSLPRRSLARWAAKRVLCAPCASPGWRDLLFRLSARVVPTYCVPPATWAVDSSGQPIYIQSSTMSARKIQIGQLWKRDGTGETYLVTRVYNEALSTIVILRKSGSENENQLRIKVERTPAGQNLPGFTPAMEDDVA